MASRLAALIYRNAVGQLGDLTYRYDPAGNRTGIGGSFGRTGLPTAIASASYDAGNRQLTFGGQTLTYDANGNLVSDGATTYTWDARNRLAALTGPTTASFQYDPLGRRARKMINGSPTDVTYDGLNPIQELSGATGVATLLTGPGIDEYLTRTDGAGQRGVLADALGSTLALTDSAGAVPTSYTYAPFGASTLSGAPTANSLEYTGRENDGTGLYYYRVRYYHPTLQRFISEDPIGFAGRDLNLYAYVINNPVAYTDPTGDLAIGALVGGGIGLIGGISGAIAQGGFSANNFSNIVISGIVGGLGGAAIGAIDPTEGVLTTAALGFGIGGLANLGGQLITNQFNTGNAVCSIDVGSALGSAFGSAIGAGFSSALFTRAIAAGSTPGLAALTANTGGLAPASLGGPIGSALGGGSVAQGQMCKRK